MTVRGHQYERRGLLAIDPKAFWEVFFCDDEPQENIEVEGCVIVDVRGPLEQHAHPWCDSYEGVISRVRAACETAARAVILRFDSPGGDAAGCFDAAEELRQIAATAGKQLHAYVDGDCCSAAYALACAAQSITMSSSSLVGSVGVLSCRDDYSAANAARGVRVALIASGARKADGHPDQPISEAEVANTQLIVDSMAKVFFDLVASARPITSEGVAELQAKVFHGPQAVSVGLADAVGPLASVLARVAGVANGDINMAASAFEKARELLQEAAEGDDANAAAAREALKALTPKEGEEQTDDPPAPNDPPVDPTRKDPQTETSTPAPGAADPPKDPEAMAAAAYREAIKAQQENAKLRAELKKRDEKEERAKLIASCAGLSPEMRTLLERAPMELVRETIASMPKGAGTTAPQLSRAPTRGNTQTGNEPPVPELPQAESDALKLRMGMTQAKPAAVNTEYTLKLGVQQPAAPAAPKAN